MILFSSTDDGKSLISCISKNHKNGKSQELNNHNFTEEEMENGKSFSIDYKDFKKWFKNDKMHTS
jgi:hypothetical protein